MQPRLKTSKKWTPLPAELVQQIQSVFSQGFTEHVRGATVEARGQIYPEEILIGVSVNRKGALKQTGWEISIPYRKDKDNVLKLLHLAVDAVGALFEQTFGAESDEDFPRLWEEIDFEGRKIYVQFSTANSELEAEADRWLGKAGVSSDEVAQGDWDEETTPDQIKATLGIDPDEDLEEDDVPKKKH